MRCLWFFPPEDSSKGTLDWMKGRYLSHQPSLSKIKPNLHLSFFHHLLRFARCPRRLLIKFSLAVVASCAPAWKIALRFEVTWEHFLRGPRCTRHQSDSVVLFFVFSFWNGRKGSVQKKKIEGVEGKDGCFGWKKNTFLWRKFLYCIKMRNTAQGCFRVRADAKA